MLPNQSPDYLEVPEYLEAVSQVAQLDELTSFARAIKHVVDDILSSELVKREDQMHEDYLTRRQIALDKKPGIIDPQSITINLMRYPSSVYVRMYDQEARLLGTKGRALEPGPERDEIEARLVFIFNSLDHYRNYCLEIEPDIRKGDAYERARERQELEQVNNPSLRAVPVMPANLERNFYEAIQLEDVNPTQDEVDAPEPLETPSSEEPPSPNPGS